MKIKDWSEVVRVYTVKKGLCELTVFALSVRSVIAGIHYQFKENNRKMGMKGKNVIETSLIVAKSKVEPDLIA
jgi:hypothetical protein